VASQPTTTTSSVQDFATLFDGIVTNVARVIHGKRSATSLALVCLVAEGHLLIEDVPGVGKTSLAKALARSLGLGWQRIQFTPDLLPSDVTGASVFDRSTSRFIFRPGAVFANVLLGDEINRASPKTQSALLEAMEERQVTVDGQTHLLPSPFLVVATQNPAEHEGTYPLPESQIDRFLLRLRLGYPERQAEVAMLDRQGGLAADDLIPVAGPAEVATMIGVADAIHVAPALRGYLVDLAAATRAHPAIALGMSPRATLGLQRSAKARAASLGREYVVPDDIKALAEPVLGHRLVLAADALLGGITVEEIVEDVLDSVAVPSGRAGADRP
jgi:MoxR-like ATPase